MPRTTQIFKQSQAHHRYVDMAKVGAFKNLPVESFNLKLACQAVGKDTEVPPEVLANVRKAHLAFWAMVAEEAKTMIGFHLT